MTRLVLLHGSVTSGASSWRAQRPLASEWELVVPSRPGFPQTDTRADVQAFLEHAGSGIKLPERLPPDLLQGAEAFRTERPPTEAELPLDPLPYPVLVVTGAHEPAFDAVAEVIASRLGAERAVLSGAGHAVQSAPGFNDLLSGFLRRAA